MKRYSTKTNLHQQQCCGIAISPLEWIKRALTGTPACFSCGGTYHPPIYRNREEAGYSGPSTHL